MEASDLQFMFSAPRDKKAGDPRVAANFHATKDVGEDGKLYMLVSEDDRTKFKVLDDSQLNDESKRNESLRATLQAALKSSSEKLDSHGFPRRQRTTSKSPSHSPRRTLSPSYTNSVHRRNTSSSPSHDATIHNEAFNRAAEDLSNTIGDTTLLNPEMSSEAKLLAAINALQKKYLDNLGVVENVFKEKKQTEERLRSLESQLKQSRRSNSLHAQLRGFHPTVTVNLTEALTASPAHVKTAPANEHFPTGGDESLPDDIIECATLPPSYHPHYSAESPCRTSGPVPPPMSRSERLASSRPPFCVSPVRISNNEKLSASQKMNLERQNAVLEARREEDRLEKQRLQALEDEQFRQEMNAYEEETRERQERERQLLEKLKKSTGSIRDWKDVKAEDDLKRKTRADRRRLRQEKWVAQQEAEQKRRKEEDKIPGFKAPDVEKLRESLQKQKTYWDLQHLLEEEKKDTRRKTQILFDRKRRKEQRKIEKEKKRVERARRLEAWRVQQIAKKEKDRQAAELRERGLEDVLQRRELDIAMTQEKERRRQEVKAAHDKAVAEQKAKEEQLAARERELQRIARKAKVLSDAKKKEELQHTLKGSIPSSAGRFTLTSFARARAVRASIEKREAEEKAKKEEWDRYMAGTISPTFATHTTGTTPYPLTGAAGAGATIDQKQAAMRNSWALNLREYVKKAREANIMPPEFVEGQEAVDEEESPEVS